MGSASSTGVKGATKVAGRPRVAWHERSAFFYEELRRPARAMIRRAFGSAFSDDEIEDLYSSAWVGTLRALDRRHQDLDDEEIRKYVFAAVANHASKEIRRRRRKPTAPLEAAGSVADAAETPDESVTSRESARIARDVLVSLPPRRRAVMLLRYGWGLQPKEVCGFVQGLSPRAYRKEITRGVDELTAKMKLVEAGEWCEDREPILKAYASGVADPDQALQAEQHLSHCRHCSDFVGRLAGHLHDLGTVALLPGALQAVGGRLPISDRIGSLFDRAKESVVETGAQADAAADVVPVVAGARGAGAAGAGIAAKLTGMGTAGKLAIACLGGGVAATACVVTGVAPLPLTGGSGDRVAEVRDVEAGIAHSLEIEPIRTPPAPGGDTAPTVLVSEPGGESRPREADSAEAEPVEVLAPSTPPEEAEFGVASAAAPSAPASASAAPSDDAAALSQEFGP